MRRVGSRHREPLPLVYLLQPGAGCRVDGPVAFDADIDVSGVLVDHVNELVLAFLLLGLVHLGCCV